MENMKDSSLMENSMEEVGSLFLMEMCMKENGKMVWLRD